MNDIKILIVLTSFKDNTLSDVKSKSFFFLRNLLSDDRISNTLFLFTASLKINT